MLWYMYTMQNYIKSNSLMYPSSCLFVIIYNDKYPLSIWNFAPFGRFLKI